MTRGLLSTSYRRRILDRDLTEACASLQGLVLDLGGEWRHRRGTFCPPVRPGVRWLCINVDPAVDPDVVADVGLVPVASAGADTVVCTEILEHVRYPEQVLAEAHRVLRPGGLLILSMPFLFRIHADPRDYQRYTSRKLEDMLREAGFATVEIRSQGLYFTVVADMIRAGLARLRPALLRWTMAALFLPLAYVVMYWERKFGAVPFVASYPGGYWAIARKPREYTASRDSLSGRPPSKAIGQELNAAVHSGLPGVLWGSTRDEERHHF